MMERCVNRIVCEQNSLRARTTGAGLLYPRFPALDFLLSHQKVQGGLYATLRDLDHSGAPAPGRT